MLGILTDSGGLVFGCNKADVLQNYIAIRYFTEFVEIRLHDFRTYAQLQIQHVRTKHEREQKCGSRLSHDAHVQLLHGKFIIFTTCTPRP